VLADKAYDADRIRELIQDQGATPNIPPKSNRRWKPCFSKRLYRERNLIERFFSKLKHFRRVATRYDKLAANFLAMIQLASMRLWRRAYESTAEDSSAWAELLFIDVKSRVMLLGRRLIFSNVRASVGGREIGEARQLMWACGLRGTQSTEREHHVDHTPRN
jgi:hypothetical protein